MFEDNQFVVFCHSSPRKLYNVEEIERIYSLGSRKELRTHEQKLKGNRCQLLTAKATMKGAQVLKQLVNAPLSEMFKHNG